MIRSGRAAVTAGSRCQLGTIESVGAKTMDPAGSESGSTYVYVGSLDKKSGQSSKKLVAAIGAGYVPSPDDPDLGYLLFVRPTAPGPAPIRTFAVMAQPFDPRKLELVGEPTAIAEQVSTAATSLTGTLVYGSGPLPADMVQLTLFDRQGKTLGTIGEPGVYRQVAFSPDERRVVAALLNHQSPAPISPISGFTI